MQPLPGTGADIGCRVGCCGWRTAKAEYFRQFPVVELQDTFYEPPSVALASKWRGLAPDGFEFTMKAWQLITHTSASPTYRRLKSKLSPTEADAFGAFRDTDQVWLAWERTRDIARALSATVILFQGPASFLPTRDNLRNLRTFFGRLTPESWQLAWEPRGKWPAELVKEICGEFNLIHCVDPFSAESTGGPGIYWRLHGRQGYRYRYTDEDLAQLEERLRQDTAVGPRYVLFNNIWMKQDGLRFIERLQQAGQGSFS